MDVTNGIMKNNHEVRSYQLDMFHSFLESEINENEYDSSIKNTNRTKSKSRFRKKKNKSKKFEKSETFNNVQMVLFDDIFFDKRNNNKNDIKDLENRKTNTKRQGIKENKQKIKQKNEQNVDSLNSIINKNEDSKKNEVREIKSNISNTLNGSSNANIKKVASSNIHKNIKNDFQNNTQNNAQNNSYNLKKRKRNKDSKEKTRICSYHFINKKTKVIEMTLTARQIKKRFGITNIKKEIIKDLSTPILYDRENNVEYIVIEGEPANERFKTLKELEDNHYRYSISSYGYVMRINKSVTVSGKRREKLKVEYDKEKNKAVSYIQTRQGKKEIILADTIVKCFYNKLPAFYEIGYINENVMDCSCENILIIPYKDFAEYLDTKKKEKENKKNK